MMAAVGFSHSISVASERSFCIGWTWYARCVISSTWIWPPAVARNTGSVRNSLPMRCTWKGIVAENMYESRCLGR